MSQFNAPWMTFIKERFPVWMNLSTIAVFVLANGLLACRLAQVKPEWYLFLIAFVLGLSFFFRLRLFDELKDYDTDLKVNPQRPLARGLLTRTQVRWVAFGLIFLELGIAAALGTHALIAMGVAIGYSILMYYEFFVGSWLRPQLLYYAMSHTFVAALLGYAIGVIVTSRPILPAFFLLSVLVNWSLFNLYEFARKTFAPAEERPPVESYSSLYGVLIAVSLSMMQALMGIFFAFLILRIGLEWFLPGFLVLFAAGVYLIITRSIHAARLFRWISGAFILYFYAVFAWISIVW